MYQPQMSGRLDLIRLRALRNAKEMVGTPYHHQGRNPGVGLDCIGLVFCAYRQAGFLGDIPSNYSPNPDFDLMSESLLKYCSEVCAPLIGDIVLFKIKSLPQHFAIYNGDTFIHSYLPSKKVCIEPMTYRWESRIIGFYNVDKIS